MRLNMTPSEMPMHPFANGETMTKVPDDFYVWLEPQFYIHLYWVLMARSKETL